MSFDDTQRSYYMSEFNRAMPTQAAIPNSDTLALALGNVDPMMPGATTVARDVSQYVSAYGAGSTAYTNDAACRATTNPATMRDPSARAGCGWYFRPSPSMSSTGAYGTKRGPMSPTLDAAGQGQWLWDPMEAALMEGMKQAGQIQSCPEIQYSRYPNIGWCQSTNAAIVTDGNGNPMFPRVSGGDCPGGGIVTNVANCPASPSAGGGGGGGGAGGGGSGSSNGDPCAPNNGMITAACLTKQAGSAGCSIGGGGNPASGLLTGAINGFSGDLAQTLQIFSQLSGGWQPPSNTASPSTWNQAFTQVKQIADSAPGRLGGAANNLAYGTKFYPCAFQPTDAGPFPAACIMQEAKAMGFSPQGAMLPANGDMSYWNTLPTWQAVQNYLAYWKNMADTPQVNPSDQRNAIYQVYGTQIQFPKTNCNNYGIMLYRYYFPPTWNWALMPPQGPQTHFLGRYIFKGGMPSTGTQIQGPASASAMPFSWSTTKDQTPSGGNLTEAWRLECNFVCMEPATHQFQLQVDDFVNMYIDGALHMSVGCCGSLTNGDVIDWMVPGQTYKLTWLMVNGGGPWSFGCNLSVGGSAFAPIPGTQTYMTQDRRLPTIGLEFADMAAGSSAVTDTNNVLTNWQLFHDAQIGPAYGQNCMNWASNGGLHNFRGYNQGIRGRALKSITMRLYIDTVMIGNGGIWPAIFSFGNFGGTNVTGNPRQGPPPETWDWPARPQNLGFYMTNGSSGAVGHLDVIDRTQGLHTTSDMINLPNKQWFHMAFVWDDDWQGAVVYINGAQASRTRFQGPSISQMYEQICIGSDSTDDYAYWTGAMAWFRGFDYRLSTDQITMDMNDAWSQLI
jgi:hypothetical protein